MKYREKEVIPLKIFYGILLPFWGTTLGAICALFLKKQLRPGLCRGLSGFAAGVMTAASVWSLLIPAIDQSRALGVWAFLPAAAGLWLGVGFLALLDLLLAKCRPGRRGLSPTALLILAVTLHNLPEGMAVGAAYAACGAGESTAAAAALAMGIALQNFPEGAIVSLPLRSQGAGRGRAVLAGVLSGAIEPLGAALTLAAAQIIVPALPCLLGFAAGAMLYVAAAELIPESARETSPTFAGATFSAGFTVMMVLDVALG